MNVVFYNESYTVVGYKENVPEGETYQLPFVIVAEIPDLVRNVPAGKIVKCDHETFYHVDAPPQEANTEEQIATLKTKLSRAESNAAENALSTQQLTELLIDLGVI